MNKLAPSIVAVAAVLLIDLQAIGQAPSLEQQLLAEPIADLAADAREKGDASRGALLFFSPGVGCAKCHDASPSPFGPNLASWKRTVSDEHLVESVLKPSASIERNFRSRMVLTVDGRSLVGIEQGRNRRAVTLQTGVSKADVITLLLDDIELEKPSDISVMPAGQVNVLRRRQEFLDLIAYLIAIRDGGTKAAQSLKPSEDELKLRIPEYESDLDHQGLIADWDDESFDRGEAIYNGLCVNCHGTVERAGSLPTSLRFGSGRFKFGNDPYSMYQTLTHGGGLMVPQTWMVPQQKYDVIHYIREHFLRDHNPSQLSPVTSDYLASLPSGSSRGPEPRVIEPWVTMDYGSMLTTTIQFGSAANIAQKAIAVRVDEGSGGISRGNAWVAFEHDTLRMAAAWSDSFVDWNSIQFNGRHRVHLRCTGDIHAANPTGPGWANPSTGSFADDSRVIGRDGRRYGPLPRDWGRFLGLHRHGDQVIFRYRVGQTEVLERPGMIRDGNKPVFVRTLNVAARPVALDMAVVTFGDSADIQRDGDFFVVASGDASEQRYIVATPGLESATSLRFDRGRLILRFEQGSEPVQGHLLIAKSRISRPARRSISSELARLGSDLGPLTQGGPPQYATPIEVPAQSWFESEGWAVDELVRPDGNPWLARTRITGLDFYPGGDSMAVCTWDGDVWKVDGLQSLGQDASVLRWRRIASGMFQPLGILVEDDRLMVTCRDQLVALRDANDDGEMDHYECYNSDHQVTEHFHEFAMGLQRDAAGHYYYAKSGRHAKTAVVPHHGTLLRVSSDGAETEIVATGFRAANGVCLNNDGTFIVTDQEGHWNPKNRINWVRPGGFYGNMYGYSDVIDNSDAAMDQPLCWITNKFDRSPAELLWVDSERFGPLQGRLLNLSYGYGRVYVVPHEHLSTTSGHRQPQGGMCQLPIPDLPTGMIRGRFSPADGQLYVGGMFSWAGSRQEQEGGLFRIRYKGNPIDMPVDLKAFEDGIDVTFTEPLDAKATQDVNRYEVTVWDLKRTKNYGSKHFNERQLKVTSASLGSDGKTIQLTIPDMTTTWGMEIVCRLQTERGDPVRRVIHNTVHQLESR